MKLSSFYVNIPIDIAIVLLLLMQPFSGDNIPQLTSWTLALTVFLTSVPCCSLGCKCRNYDVDVSTGAEVPTVC